MLVMKTVIIVLFVIALQIFFEPERAHWVATAYIDGEVRLFDSSFNGRLSHSIEYQICRVYRDTASEGNILVTVVPVPQQDDDSICGVMTIANGYHAICGSNLATLTYIQEEMRNHLASCMENELFIPFPTSQEPAPASEDRTCGVSFINIEINCSCGRSDTWQDMVGCDGCNKWFHLDCSGLVSGIPDEDWYCLECI